MEISNDTGQDTRYKVTGTGGSGMAPYGHFPFRREEAEKWAVLQAGDVVSYPLHPKESCVVYFFVNGQGCTAVASSDDDRIHLVHTGAAFRAEVRKTPQAKPAKSDRSARAV